MIYAESKTLTELGRTTMQCSTYDDLFFKSHAAEMASAASAVVPLVIRFIQPRSVIDIGCGRGAWLKAFKESGVPRVMGIDGDYVDREALLIREEEFSAQDLNRDFSIIWTLRFGGLFGGC